MRKNKLVLVLSLTIVFAVIVFGCKKSTKIGSKTFDTSKTYNICISQSAELSSYDAMRKGMIIGLKDLGLLEDVNVNFSYENAKGNKSFAKQIAEAFASKKPDIIVGIGQTSSIEMNEVFKDKRKPMVFLGCAYIDKLGFADKQGKPIGNITGVQDSHLIEENLNFIHVNYPNVKRLGIIYDTSNVTANNDIDYYKFYGQGNDIDIYTIGINKAEDIDKALSNILPKVDGIQFIDDVLVNANAKEIIAKVNNSKKTAFGYLTEHKEFGAIVSTERDYQLVGKKAAEIVKRILVDGERAKDINVETIDFK